VKHGVFRLFLLLLLCVWLAAACNPSSEEEKLVAGRDVYLKNCSHCHQPEGQGFAQIFPPLAGNPIVRLDDPSPAIEMVLHGRAAMPSFYDSLTVEERAQVISYIRSAWGNNASSISTSQAQ
jgi:alcohol dehydrogenase (quinone), cytochrome c subunit